MLKIFGLILLVWSLNAHAVLKLACMLAQDGGDKGRELKEQELRFNAVTGEYVSNHTFEFSILPNYASTVQIFEVMNHNNYGAPLYWTSDVATRRKSDGLVVARGHAKHSFKLPAGEPESYYNLYCHAYDATLSLQPFTPADGRENLRYAWAGGPAYKREYVNANPIDTDFKPDLMDLWRQLVADPSVEGRLLAETVRRVESEGFRPTWLHPYESYGMVAAFKLAKENSNCTQGEARFKCDVEEFSITHVYTGKVRKDDGPVEPWHMHVSAEGKIFREHASRAIRGYSIHSVMTHTPRWRGGGGSSSSGGRIGGAN